ncbi:MAG TPA: hypothetical protein VE404_09145 [Verrucomicrobiae bacterium]|nr:hypothetical protein [Verrucomicrobiae bacterium]
MKARAGGVVVALLCLPGALPAAPPIPAERLTKETYISPDGAFTLALPPLAGPGSKIEERRVGPAAYGVFLDDETGVVYYVLRSDNSAAKATLEQMTSGIRTEGPVREKKRIRNGGREEVRIAAISETQAGLVVATSLFLQGAAAYEVTAGVTARHGEPEPELIERAGKNLEAFLKGLKIKEQETPP